MHRSRPGLLRGALPRTRVARPVATRRQARHADDPHRITGLKNPLHISGTRPSEATDHPLGEQERSDVGAASS